MLYKFLYMKEDKYYKINNRTLFDFNFQPQSLSIKLHFSIEGITISANFMPLLKTLKKLNKFTAIVDQKDLKYTMV